MGFRARRRRVSERAHSERVRARALKSGVCPSESGKGGGQFFERGNYRLVWSPRWRRLQEETDRDIGHIPRVRKARRDSIEAALLFLSLSLLLSLFISFLVRLSLVSHPGCLKFRPRGRPPKAHSCRLVCNLSCRCLLMFGQKPKREKDRSSDVTAEKRTPAPWRDVFLLNKVKAESKVLPQ